jgi:hypothetical protein
MSDIALPLPGATPARGNVTAFKLYLVAFTVFAILAALNVSLVRSKMEENCDTRPGPFSSGFNAGFQTSSCTCSPYFSFAEACPTPAMLLPPAFAPAL